MNVKVKLSRLQLKRKQQSKDETTTETKPEPSTNTTPVSRKSTTCKDEDDEQASPFCMRFTQDSGDDEFDVVWDWESPRSKGTHTIHRKRLMHSSPNVPKRAAPSQNISRYNSLKAELEELANKLSDNNTSDTQTEVFLKPELPVLNPESTDLFDDDSFDVDMIRCSLQVEEALNETVNNNSTNKLVNRNYAVQNIDDDSFDVFLEDVKEEELLSQASSSSNSSQNPLNMPQFPSTINASTIPKNLQSAPTIPNNLQNTSSNPTNLQNTSIILNNQQNAPTIPNNLQHVSTFPNNYQNGSTNSAIQSPRSISRYNSVPVTNKNLKNPTFSQFQRTKSEDFSEKSTELKCSPEEIEKKRQEARLKLEKRKKQWEIERKRLEALERLKKNRLQRIQNNKVT